MKEGFGLFETMRSYNNKIVYLDEHLERMKKSSRLIGVPFTFSHRKLKDIIKNKVKICGFKDARVRLTLCNSAKTTDILASVTKYRPFAVSKYNEGFSAKASSLRQNEFSVLSRVKTTNRIFYDLSLKEAKENGFNEAIILNNRGVICEATRSNIFFIKENELFTPDLECGCLGGITRKVIFDLAKINNLKIYEGSFTLQDLYSADEAFLTNSLMGVMPLGIIEKHRIAKGARFFRLTRFFINKYNDLLKNGT